MQRGNRAAFERAGRRLVVFGFGHDIGRNRGRSTTVLFGYREAPPRQSPAFELDAPHSPPRDRLLGLNIRFCPDRPRLGD